MISITLSPELFRLAKITVGDITIEYDEFLDRLTLRGIMCTTDEQLDKLDEQELMADFIDTDGKSLYIGKSISHGKFAEFGFCNFAFYVNDISTHMKIEDIAEIRLIPT